MNWKKLVRLIPILLIVLVLLVSPALANGAQKYEYYDAGDDAAVELYGNIWGAQTFTTGATSHTVSSVRLELYREGTPSTITVSIRTTAAGDPSGTDLTSGTIDGDAITTDTAGVWYAFDLTNYSLEASTMYAIVVRAVAGDSTNSVHWRSDASAGAEPNGQEETSNNAGTTWTGDSDDDFMFEVWGDPVMSVNQAQVFTGYREGNDLLFVIEYENTCPPYYPSDDPARYFDLQLRSTDGATVYAQTTCRAWDNQPGSIYLNADEAASLTSGSLYRIYLYGDFTGTPSTYYTLTAGDWRGGDLSFLDKWVISTAHSLEEYYDTDLVTVVSGKGEVLNEEGGVIFANGIPALNEVRPDIFKIALHTIPYEPEEYTDAFQESTTWPEMVGPDVEAILNSGGDLLNVSGKNFGAIILFGSYIAFAVFLVGKGHATVGLALGIPIILVGGWLHLIDIIIIGVSASVVTMLIVWQMWWSKT